MKNGKYFVGLDIGTDSVGYAVSTEQYDLYKCKGEPMWGVTLFDEAQPAVNRRGFRIARRRLDRRQQRIRLLMELFAAEISKTDEDFFRRIKESYLYPDCEEQKVRLFKTYSEQKAYARKYPTIHHLITELMNSTEPHDARLVYVACAWLIAHRGHFLSEVDKHSVDKVTDFQETFQKLTKFLKHDEYRLPWKDDIDPSAVENALKAKLGIVKKTKLLAEALFHGEKIPKAVNDEYEYNYDLLLKLLCGGKVSIKDLFDKDEYEDLEEKSVALSMDDEKLVAIMQSIDEQDAELITVSKSVYDWSVLVDILNGKPTISEAKVDVYEQHKRDLKLLKRIILNYVPYRYDEVFRSDAQKNNYVAYIGKNKISGKKTKVKKSNSREEFCKYILSVIKPVTPDDGDATQFDEMRSRLEASSFMPKQVDSDNRVIPYQLYWHELNKILDNAKSYIPFLNDRDADGISGADKILSVFEFRIPYYVGPLKENRNDDPKLNHWMKRKVKGRIYPWNFHDIVDLDASEEAFIARMTNACSYLPGEDVLPKNSLLYCAFEVLNEINNIRINGNELSVEAKQSIYNNVFMQPGKATPKKIKDHLISNHFIRANDVITGLDITVKSSLKPFLQFRKLVEREMLTYADAERIIERATYSEDKSRFGKWIHREFPQLPEREIKYISGLKFKDFGRLSKRLLCGIEGVNKETGESLSIICALWETNYNLMQLMSDRFTFAETIEQLARAYYDLHPKSISERLEAMYVSNAVKRPIVRAIDILKDVVHVQGRPPERIFVEMARGADDDQKRKRTSTRLQQIRDLYEKVDKEDVRILSEQLDEWGEIAHNKLQSDKLFLYFLQLGKCLYTGKAIDLDSVIAGDGKYNIEHIYPRSFVKDDSIVNNKILVDSKANGEKKDSYPIDPNIRSTMDGYWHYLNAMGLISDEKYKRLKRSTHFTDDERYEFINRQLVETRQSTKVVATLLKELYPKTEIIYVKAGLVSDFRQQFDCLKSRAVNDLHHAKDAYLNIVVGNVWHSKFSRQFWRAEEKSSVKPEIIFTHPVICQGETVWNGASDKDRVIDIARKNTAHMTMYSYCKHSGQNGGFFNQNPLGAKKGLIPLKKDMPTEIYGGYDSATVFGFVLARYRIGNKAEISFVPVKLLFMKQFMENDDFATKYVSEELGEKALDVEILFNKRIIKNYAMLSVDGARFCIRGKAGLSDIGLMNMMPFMCSREVESYIKKLESFDNKRKKNGNIVWDERYDGISKEKNDRLYLDYVDKLSKWPYNKRPGNAVLVEKLKKRASDFRTLDIFKQTSVLLQIQGIFGRMKQADLKELGESASSGIARMSMNLTNWKKNYTDVRIVDQSASGLFETMSNNLLEML